MYKYTILLLALCFSIQTLQAQDQWASVSTNAWLTGTTKTTTPEAKTSTAPIAKQKIQLNAELVDSTVILTWDMEATGAKDHFLVQRRADNGPLFRTIGEIDSDGDSAQFIHFDDLPQQSGLQYRLVEIREDGSQIEHDLVPLSLAIKK